ncbi:MAG: DUF92 domain-containing protein [Acidobacteria bacterium]|nr:DUF92 domain-containing protein [Acidobacteriota bacterium]
MSQMPVESERAGLSSEGLRKLVHMFFGIFAFALGWLTTLQAAILAMVAALFNRFVLPAAGGRRIARSDVGWDSGIVIYPISVLVVIVVFHDRPALAAIVWCILAFGDGIATLVGRNLPLAPLPWNPSKSIAGSLSFIALAAPIAWMASSFVDTTEDAPGAPLMVIVIIATITAAIVESLPLGIDDNIVIPLFAGYAAALVSTAVSIPHVVGGGATAVWLVINLVLGCLGWLARSVSVSGMFGGIALGAVMIVFGGWELYLTMLLFFVIGSVVTKMGFARKAAAGLAQESGGRRGFSHAFSNIGVASILAIFITSSSRPAELLWMAAIASLATAAADTTASEIGQLIGRRAFLPLTLKRVPAGTEGAVSLEGTAAGAIAGFVVASFGVWLIREQVAGSAAVAVIIVGLSAIVGSWLESVAGSFNRQRGLDVSNGALNFLNTMAGATLAYWAGMVIL